MNPDQYHEVLLALDQALEVFKKASPLTQQDDHQLRYQIAAIRAQVLRAESGIPFPLDVAGGHISAQAVSDERSDPDLTLPPWSHTPRTH